MSLSTAIMAHPRRADFVTELAEHLPGAEVVWDRDNDRWDTGRRSLLAYDPAADWHVVIQDDAILCRNFLRAAARALAAVDGERPVSFYMGRARPSLLQGQVTAAVRRAALSGEPWVKMGGPWWGVGIALPVSQIPDVVRWGDNNWKTANYDLRIARFYEQQRIDCWYTAPSLIDHRPVSENPSLIAGRTGNRRAHWFAGQAALDIDFRSKGAPLPIAARPIYRLRAGRSVLIARRGDPIPPGVKVPASAVLDRPVAATPEEPLELASLTRSKLDELAARRGVEEPHKLPNKAAVLAAIEAAPAKKAARSVATRKAKAAKAAS